MFQELYHQPPALVACSCCPVAFSSGTVLSSLLISPYESLHLTYIESKKTYTTKWSELWEELILVKTFPQELRHLGQVPTMI